jgi:hypothetical protein
MKLLQQSRSNRTTHQRPLRKAIPQTDAPLQVGDHAGRRHLVDTATTGDDTPSASPIYKGKGRTSTALLIGIGFACPVIIVLICVCGFAIAACVRGTRCCGLGGRGSGVGKLVPPPYESPAGLVPASLGSTVESGPYEAQRELCAPGYVAAQPPLSGASSSYTYGAAAAGSQAVLSVNSI